MTRTAQSQDREVARQAALTTWAPQHAIDLRRFDEGQRWLLFAAFQMVQVLGEVEPLQRVLGYCLAHSGMALGSQVIGALLGVTDRAVRLTQAVAPTDLLHSVQHPVGGHAPPKMLPIHAGPVARFLAAQPRASVAELLAFIAKDLHVTIERHALREFLDRYGLGCLQGDQVQHAPPLLASPRSAELSC